MKSAEWRALNEQTKKEFDSFVTAVRNKQKILNVNKLSSLLSSSLSIVSHEIKSKHRLSLIYEVRDLKGTRAPYGMASVILSNLPQAKDMSTDYAANMYYEILKCTYDKLIPAGLFFNIFNYTNSLIELISNNGVFNKNHEYGKYEKKFRDRLVSEDAIVYAVHEPENLIAIAKAFDQSLKRVANNHIRCKDYASAIESCLSEYKKNVPNYGDLRSDIKYHIIHNIYYYNNLLGVVPNESLLPDFNIAVNSLNEERRNLLIALKDPSIGGLEIKDINVSQVDGYINKKASTKIVFIVPYLFPIGDYVSDGWKIRVSQSDDPFLDPIFSLLHLQEFIVNGMPLALLSTALNLQGAFSIFCLESDELFRPTIETNEDGLVTGNNSGLLKEIHGEYYDPYISKIKDVLIGIKDPKWPPKKVIAENIKDIDSYSIEYPQPNGDRGFHMFQPLIKPDVFIEGRDRFVKRFREALNKGHSPKRLKELIFDDNPIDAIGLRDFTQAVFQELIIRECEKGEWWKTVWDDNTYSTPRKEVDIARDIYHTIVGWFRVKGLILDREVSAAGGSIDMIATGSSGGIIHRCGIEIKFAHSAASLTGLCKQLPLYLDDLDAEFGLYVALWCKSSKFDKPKIHNTIEDFVDLLNENNSRKGSIVISFVDASPKKSPSKQK